LYGLKIYGEYNEEYTLENASYPSKMFFAMGGVIMNFFIA
jgi:hypothetical protein